MKKNKVVISLETFKEVFLENTYDENMFMDDGSINPKYNSFKKTGTIANIFEDHWEEIYKQNKDLIDLYRPNADKEIKKIIDCHNKDLGCSCYVCPNCDSISFIGYTCKSRICSSCGYKYKLERVENILQTAYKCNHRQIVFTIPKELRKYFFFPFRDRLSILFDAVCKTIYSIYNESYKQTKKKKKGYTSKIKYTPGFFAFLHTFGRDLKFNPHIHILIAEIKLGSDDSCKKMTYFNYDALSKRFQKILLDLLLENIGPSFKKEMSSQYMKHKKGYYVYAEPKKFKSLKEGIEYVTRYCGRVPISENRIINYDGENVTFSYNDHKDESYHEVTVTAKDFIFMLLRHLIPSNFKIIRYYGFYRKKHNMHDKMVMLIAPFKRSIRKQFLKYEICVERFFKRNPYKCPKCNCKMDYLAEVT